MSRPSHRSGRPAAGPLGTLAVLILVLAGFQRPAAADDVSDVDAMLMTGACCFFQTMQCLEVAQQACNNQGGVFLGVGTSCRDGGCDVGACCIGDTLFDREGRTLTSGAPGGCLVIIRASCENLKGGVFLGEGTTCDDAPCLPVACCLPSGNCTEVLQHVCIAIGGDPVQVPGGNCDKVLCQLMTGACCLCDGTESTCSNFLTQEECVDAGGVYLGDGILCEEGDAVYTVTSNPNTPIPDNNETGIFDTIDFPFGFTIQDIRVRLTIDHTYVGDLCITLEHEGEIVVLVQRPGTNEGTCHSGSPTGCSADNYVNIILDDLGTGGSIQSACVNNLTSPPAYTPYEPLSAFIGLQAAGPWTLHVRDRASFDTGTLVSWSLELEATSAGSCGDVITCGPPPDPCTLPGRPDPNDPESGDRVLRGFIVGYAVDWAGNEIRWNHLSAGATTVDYRDASAMEFPAATFTTMAAANGAVLPNPGVLSMDGVKYAAAPQMLLFNFTADGSTSFSGPIASLTAATELTLMPLDISFVDGAVPARTRAEFNVWNENEVKFSGAYRCVTCWDSTLLERYVDPNHMHIGTLLTDRGKARIEGVASPHCPGSGAHALLGVQARKVHDGIGGAALSGSILTSLGLRSATMTVPITAPPPESPQTAPAGAVYRRAAAAGSFAAASHGGVTEGAPVQAMGGVLTPRMGTDKGSLFVIPRVELKWDAQGNLVRDTFVHLTNDFPADVRVQMWFVNGDPDGIDQFGCDQPGWNFVDVLINLTQDQPLWWSVLSGQPTGVSPFTVLDP